jgi:hypothetical protein
MAPWLARNFGDVVSIVDLIAVNSPSSMPWPPARMKDQIVSTNRRCGITDAIAFQAIKSPGLHQLIITRNQFGTETFDSAQRFAKDEPSRGDQQK